MSDCAGDLERTMTRHFHQSSNLRALIRYRLLPESLSEFYSLLAPLLASEYRGTLSTEAYAVGSDDWTISAQEDQRKAHSAVLPEAARVYQDRRGAPLAQTRLCDQAFHRGASYEPIPSAHRNQWTKGRNSYIQYRKENGELAVGRILHLVSSSTVDTIIPPSTVSVIVQPLKELDEEDIAKDPYRKYPDLGGRLVYHLYEEQLQLLDLANIVSHIARCPYVADDALHNDCLVVWPLDRVSLSCCGTSQR